MKHAALVVLEALLQGHEVELDGYTVVLKQAGSEIEIQDEWYTVTEDALFIKAEFIKGDVTSHTYLGFSDFTVESLLKFCKKLTSEEVAALNAGIVLTKIHRDRSLDRGPDIKK